MATAKAEASKPDTPVYRTFEDYPIEDLLQYAGVDCLVTSGVLNKVFPTITEKKPYIYSTHGEIIQGHAPAIIDFMHSAEMPAHEFLIDCELNGIRYDVELNKSQSARIEAELPQYDDNIFSLYGTKFNPDSGKELAKILYSDLGFEPPSYTQKKEPSTDGDALKSLAETHDLEWLRVLAKRNNLASVHRTFFRSYVEDFVKSDGRIHPSYNLFGTSSYRITGDKPNLTQLPNAQTEEKLGYAIRQCYTVDLGYLFLCADQSSAEVKILGALCKDPKLLRAIAEGKDFHSYSATQMHGLDYDDFVIHLNYEGYDKDLLAIKKRFKGLRQASKALTLNSLRLLGVILVE